MQIFFLSSNLQYKNFQHWDKEIRDCKEGKIEVSITKWLKNKYLLNNLHERMEEN
jgi:hypothetical protein